MGSCTVETFKCFFLGEPLAWNCHPSTHFTVNLVHTFLTEELLQTAAVHEGDEQHHVLAVDGFPFLVGGALLDGHEGGGDLGFVEVTGILDGCLCDL